MKNKYPKISLVTACYNHKDYIAETIESVLSQGYPNLEYIVIDDGSTDGSWDIIKQYKDKLSYCERLEGYRDTPTIALNYGFDKTTGEIMGWLNSDDILLPNSLFTLAEFFVDHEEVAWLTGAASTINHASQLISSKVRLKHRYDYLIGDWKVIQQESTFWRTSLWEKVGGKLNEEKKWAFDTELWTKFFEHEEHCHMTAPLGAFRRGKQSKSVSDKQSFLGPNEAHLAAMKKRTTTTLKFYANIYRFLKVFRFMWAVIPHRLYTKIPFLKRFQYILYEYDYANSVWKRNNINPFRAVN